jgi:SagB-type dehydrogenase family enzyme
MKKELINLPSPKLKGEISLEEALSKRHSTRSFPKKSLTLQEISQLLWAAQGLTKEDFYRTAPSAGALYPLEIYVIAENVEELTGGFYHYRPKGHKLEFIKKGSFLRILAETAYSQEAIQQCSAAFVITGVIERTAKKYHERAEQYVHIEVGHAGQNLLLQAEALGLGAVPVGAFEDEEIKGHFPVEGEPFYIIPVGRK